MAGFLSLALAAGSAFAANIPTQAYDEVLAARVPAAIRDVGVLRNAVQGTFAPHTIQKEDKSLDGATSDFAKAVALPFFIMRSFRALLRREGVDCSKIKWVLSRCAKTNPIEPNRGKDSGMAPIL